MQFSNLLSIFTFAAAASATTVSYDAGYDEAGRSLTAVSCSDGPNGLMTRFGWQTQGEIPRFAHIGGVAAVASWNSPSCGTCWSATYNGKTVYILAIDHAAEGVNMALSAMNELTNNQAVALGRIDAVVSQVAVSFCGLK